MTALCEPLIDEELDDDLSDDCFQRVPNDREAEADLPAAPIRALTAATAVVSLAMESRIVSGPSPTAADHPLYVRTRCYAPQLAKRLPPRPRAGNDHLSKSNANSPAKRHIHVLSRRPEDWPSFDNR